MQQEWVYNNQVYSARIPANVLRFVQGLGADMACELFLQLGGSKASLDNTAKSEVSNKIVRIVGLKAFEKLQEQWRSFEEPPKRIPLANSFIIRHLRSKGSGVTEIAAKVRCSDVSVRYALRNEVGRPMPNQMKGGL